MPEKLIVEWGYNTLPGEGVTTGGWDDPDYSKDGKLERRRVGHSGINPVRYVYHLPHTSNAVAYDSLQAAVHAAYGFDGEIEEI